MSGKMDWVEVAEVGDIPVVGSRVVEVNGRKIAVFRLSDGQVRAIGNDCPHRGGPLAEGIVAGEFVYCPLHDWKVSLKDGEVQAPDTGCAPTYSVEVADGKVYLLLPDLARV